MKVCELASHYSKHVKYSGSDDATLISFVLHINFARFTWIVKLSYRQPYYLVGCLV